MNLKNPQQFIDNEASNILVFDQSQNYTGWVWYKPHNHRIIRYGCIRAEVLLEGQEFSGVMEKREAFQKAFSHSLRKLLITKDPDHTQVVMEKPIGSQSARAAWSLAMASQGVTTATVCMLGKDPITYSERDAKMYMFGESSVPKSKISKYMWAHWKSNNINPPEIMWRHETRQSEIDKMKEDVADAMLILNLHIHKLHNDA